MTIEQAIDLYGDMVTKICIMNLKNTEDSKDCFQEVFIKLFKHGVIEDPVYLKHWLIRVTINTCKDYRKVFYKNTIDIDDVIVSKEEKSYILLPVLMELPSRYKNILYLYYYEGYKVEEIAHILHMNPNTIKTRLNRGRELLKKKVGDENG